MPTGLVLISTVSLWAGGVGAPPAETVAWQAALDRAGYSAGIIDGQPGRKLETAIRAFQSARGLKVTGKQDDETAAALGVGKTAPTIAYKITAADVKMVQPPPVKWQDKAKRSRLGYRSLADLLGERGHCTQPLLARLNPRVNLNALRAGDTVVLPSVWSPQSPPRAAKLRVDLAAKTICVLDGSSKVIGLFHCSIAKDKAKRPSGKARVVTVSKNPDYLFDPKMWPEVKDVKKKLRIPPGPRNPVGLAWIGLSLPGYGIHGTPEPAMIGKTGSHGCFRLANWDAVRLSRMVRVGTPVEFIDEAVSYATRP